MKIKHGNFSKLPDCEVSMPKEKVFISHGDLILDKIYDDDLNLLKQDGGGCNWNDLYHLATMGETCYAIGSKGNDEEGKLALQSLSQVGINTNYVITENKKTNIMNIIIPSNSLKDNSVIHAWYSPITNEYTMNFSEHLPTNLPEELKDKQLYLILDKFLPVNLSFLQKNRKADTKICLDVGHIRFFEHFTRQYLTSFFSMANFIQINDSVTSLLLERFHVSNIIEFFQLFHFDLLILTKGKKGATFLFYEGDKLKIIDKQPPVIVDIVDSSGAGDAFFSKVLQQYAYCDKIDTNFVHQTFKLANEASRQVLLQVGSRIIKD